MIPDSPLHLILLRHAKPDGVTGRCVGHTDVPLSDEGRASLRALGNGGGVVADVISHQRSHGRSGFMLLSSDLVRARDTAAYIASTLDAAPVVLDARLREMNFGAWDGALWQHLEATDGARLAAWMEDWKSARPPGGETVADVLARVDAVLHALCQGPAHTVLVVGHAGWIRLAWCRLHGLSPDRMFEVDVQYATPMPCMVDRAAVRSVPVE